MKSKLLKNIRMLLIMKATFAKLCRRNASAISQIKATEHCFDFVLFAVVIFKTVDKNPTYPPLYECF